MLEVASCNVASAFDPKKWLRFLVDEAGDYLIEWCDSIGHPEAPKSHRLEPRAFELLCSIVKEERQGGNEAVGLLSDCGPDAMSICYVIHSSGFTFMASWLITPAIAPVFSSVPVASRDQLKPLLRLLHAARKAGCSKESAVFGL